VIASRAANHRFILPKRKPMVGGSSSHTGAFGILRLFSFGEIETQTDAPTISLNKKYLHKVFLFLVDFKKNLDYNKPIKKETNKAL